MKNRFLVRYWVKGSKEYLNSNKLVYNDGTYTQVSTKQSRNTFELIPEQCTSLKDKNGKLIFEGDILKNIEQRIKVVFDEQRYCFMFEYQDTKAYKPISCIDILDDSNLEVIGNIHENADLLEQLDVAEN